MSSRNFRKSNCLQLTHEHSPDLDDWESLQMWRFSIIHEEHFPETKGYCFPNQIRWSKAISFPSMTFICLAVWDRTALSLALPYCFASQFHCWPLEGTPHPSSTFNPISGRGGIFGVSKVGRLGEPVVLHLVVQSSFTETLVFNPHISDH